MVDKRRLRISEQFGGSLEDLAHQRFALTPNLMVFQVASSFLSSGFSTPEMQRQRPGFKDPPTKDCNIS